MQYLLVIFLQLTLFAQSYNFDEIKFVSGVNNEIKKSGNITIEEKKIIITYSNPKFKQIIKDNENISIEDSSGKIYILKGRAKQYTSQFIDIMIILGDFEKLQKPNRDFNLEKQKSHFYVTFIGSISSQIQKAEVKIKESRVVSFKMFLPHEDTLTIIKK